MDEQTSLFDDNPAYDAFVEKFKPKKTTDDCYTPPEIYNVIRGWACEKYGIDPETIVRPFWPGGDYEAFDYPEGCTVLDNPPFSILSKICVFYLEQRINFFLFAPSLTCFNKLTAAKLNHVICDCNITYENGARVRTSFVSSYGGDIVAQTAPDLTQQVNEISERIHREKVRQLPKYAYPDHVVTAALMQRYAKYGVELTIRRDDCIFVRSLDAQKSAGKEIYGGGLLLSERAAAERAAAERAAAERAAAERAAAERAAAIKWLLSEREKKIVESLG